MSKQKGNVHEGHRERLRERYRENGLDSFADHEILELLLGYSIAQKDTNPIGHELIDRFGNLQGVFEASEEALLETPEVGPRAALLMKMIPDICRRYFTQLHNGDLRPLEMQDPTPFFVPRFLGRKEECLYAAFLDDNKSLIQCDLQYVGSINAVEIHAGKILKRALHLGCRFVIIAHNHFTDSLPSTTDMEATRSVYYALKEYGIELLDHVVVCGNSGTSMRLSGHFAKSL